MKKVSHEEAEALDIVACNLLTEAKASDDVDGIGPCARCGRLVYWSNTSPVRPPKWCIDCLEAVYT